MKIRIVVACLLVAFGIGLAVYGTHLHLPFRYWSHACEPETANAWGYHRGDGTFVPRCPNELADAD